MLAIVAVSVLGALVVGLTVVLLRQNARIEEVLRATSEQLKAEQARAALEQESRRQSFDNALKGLEERLRSYQDLLRQWESDRAQKFGRLEQELAGASQATLKLQETTGSLANILGNVKLRGQWGERLAEDIIRHSGLLETVHYVKQAQQSASATRPDFSFLLPDGKRVNMDVKFPLDNYLRMANATGDAERETARKEFLKNVRARISEIRSREYINPAENTLDFVLLFIPNEQVFGFIQEAEPGLMDMALKDKVVLCSPFTLYATLAVIRQAHEHFRFEKDLKKIIQLIDQFARYYETFKARFEDIGKLVGDLDRTYADVRDKSFRNLDVKIRHIDDFKKGHMPELAAAEGEQSDGGV
ncbi:MAG: DNA recombination protein RmuC [Candidatus Omnitrophica bacterium]|nr:DNA recombination protein RmuC [Candidatus Omnitrophota bacterium]